MTPFLVSYATQRKSHPDIGGHYCHSRDVWVEGTKQGEVPIVLMHSNLSELVTKTATQQEMDDENFPPRPLSELVTKTDVQQESDDQSLNASSILEMETKTTYEVESDDQDYTLF